MVTPTHVCISVSTFVSYYIDFSVHQNPEPKITTNKKSFIVFMPILDHSSKFALKKQLANIVSKFYAHLQLIVVFINRLSVCSFFKYKDQVPYSLLSNVFFFINTSVVSVIPHVLVKRFVISPHVMLSIRECLSVLFLGLHHLVKVGLGSIVVKPNIVSEMKTFSVLHVSNKFYIKICESVCIHQLNPNLNSMSSSTPLNNLC